MSTSVLTFPASHNRFAGIEPGDINEVEAGALVALALAVLASRHEPGEALTSPAQTQAYLRLRLSERTTEVFGVIFLDNRHRVLAMEDLFSGTIDGASVYPRVVVQQALERNAAALVLYHNHPSGLADVSQADRTLTTKLTHALALVDIRVLDHVVVGAQGCVSFAERGWL